MQKRLDSVLLHEAGVEEVPSWELADLPDQVIGRILTRVGLAGRSGSVRGDLGASGSYSPASGSYGSYNGPSSPQKLGAGGRKGPGSPVGPGSTSNAILQAFLKLSDAAQLHNLHGMHGGGGIVAAAATAAAYATQNKRKAVKAGHDEFGSPSKRR